MNLTPEQVKDLEVALNEIISSSLWGPSGDPKANELSSAARAYKLLKSLGLKIESKEDIFNTLTSANIYRESFL